MARFGRDVLDSKRLRRTELFPVCNVDIRAARFSTMCVSTGKSANATLIHCALHPVATSEMLKIRDSMILLIEFAFMSVLLL